MLEVTKAELIRRIINKNDTFIAWLKVIVMADCGHVGWSNTRDAEDLIENLEEQNKLYMQILVKMADGEDDI